MDCEFSFIQFLRNHWLLVHVVILMVLISIGGYRIVIWMPRESFSGPLPDLTANQTKTKKRLRNHVRHLALTIGERNLHNSPEALRRTADYIENRLGEYGHEAKKQRFSVDGHTVSNVYSCSGKLNSAKEVVVVGAHYDTVRGSPGANDNGSGVAALLELARKFRSTETMNPVCFVGFVNEEPPYFKTNDMGSLRFAKHLKSNDVSVRAMISLETIGYYSNEPDSQNHIFPLQYFYPNKGNFITFVGNMWRGSVVREAIGVFRKNIDFPSEGITAPSFVPGVSWSDHQSFWKQGYPAFMVTDTAPYRYPYYHTADDLPVHLDFKNMALVISGLESVIHHFASN